MQGVVNRGELERGAPMALPRREKVQQLGVRQLAFRAERFRLRERSVELVGRQGGLLGLGGRAPFCCIGLRRPRRRRRGGRRLGRPRLRFGAPLDVGNDVPGVLGALGTPDRCYGVACVVTAENGPQTDADQHGHHDCNADDQALPIHTAPP